MKKLLSVKYSAGAFNTALFILRVGTGIIMIVAHGYDKLVNFQDISPKFINFMGIGQPASLALSVFAEFFCSVFLILGLFTRLAAVPLMINMIAAIIMAHGSDVFGQGEKASLFFLIYFTILLVGPGKASIDGMVNK